MWVWGRIIVVINYEVVIHFLLTGGCIKREKKLSLLCFIAERRNSPINDHPSSHSFTTDHLTNVFFHHKRGLRNKKEILASYVDKNLQTEPNGTTKS